MNLYAVDKLVTEARRLAAEYRRVTGKVLPLSGEIAVHDAVRLLGLLRVEDPSGGYEATAPHGSEVERFQIKARVIFDVQKGAHRLGELKLDKAWDTLLLVLMDADYEPSEIYAVPRAAVLAALGDRPAKKGSLTVPKIKHIGTRAWCREELPEASDGA